MSTKTALTLVAFIALIALSGCGFSPVYGDYANRGTQGQVATALDNVYIDSIPDRSGQKLRNHLMDRFYRTGGKNLADAGYRLQVASIGESVYGLGIAKDATATRSQIKLTTTMNLIRVGDSTGKPLITRTITAVTSFDTLASEYTTLVTRDDARGQAINDLADQIATMLELYFANPARFPAAGQVEPDKNDRRLSHDLRAYITDQLDGY